MHNFEETVVVFEENISVYFFYGLEKIYSDSDRYLHYLQTIVDQSPSQTSVDGVS